MGNAKSDENVGIEPLNSDELNIIKKLWASINDKDDLGIRIMISLFQSHSDIKYLWIFASNLETEEEMLNNSELRYHGQKVITTIEKILNFLTSPTINANDQVDLIRLGRRHHNYGLIKDYFILFENSSVDCLEKNINNKQIFDEESQEAWRHFIKFIFNHYQDGMRIEENEQIEKEKLKSDRKTAHK